MQLQAELWEDLAATGRTALQRRCLRGSGSRGSRGMKDELTAVDEEFHGQVQG